LTYTGTGWRSWNCYHGDVNEALIRATVDAVTSRKRQVDGRPTSLLDCGYDHVGVDDGWQECNAGLGGNTFHGPDGRPILNTTKFPDLKGMVAYGHKAGVRMGWYDTNCMCCDEYHINQNETYAQLAYKADIQMLRNADFDSVKQDNCGDDSGKGFVARTHYINVSGRALLIEDSDQGHGLGSPRGLPSDPDGWCGANFFRAEGDIGPDFDGIVNRPMDLVQYQHPTKPISRPGCWAYLDMMEVGNLPGPNAYNESRTHFGLWCINSSPLVIGMDVTDSAKLDAVWDILTNKEAIAVNQAWHGHPGRFVWRGSVGNTHYSLFAKALGNGAQAALLYNADSSSNLDLELPLKLLDLNPLTTYKVRDVWGKQDLGEIQGNWTIEQLNPHDSRFVIFSPKMAL